MTSQHTKKFYRPYPKEPGVYLFKDSKGKVLYVGKAKNLSRRLQQYFRGHDGREMVSTLLKTAADVEVTITRNEKEALLLESVLIKKYRPRFNVRLWDTFFYLQLDMRKKWTDLILVRKPINHPQVKIFGPIPSVKHAQKTISFVERYFGLRSCSDDELKRRKRPCLLFQMHRCLAPCTNECSPSEYDAAVQNVRLFLTGKNQLLLSKVEQNMHALAELEKFEEAAKQRDLMLSLQKTLARQSIVEHRNSDRDIWGWFRHGDEGVLSILPIRQGQMQAAINAPFSDALPDDAELLSTLVLGWYGQGSELPSEVVLPVVPVQQQDLESVLSEQLGSKVTLLCPKMGKRFQLLQLANHNAKSCFEHKQSLAEQRHKTLLVMQKKLQLKRYPRRIECFDNSHFQGEAAVASMVVFIEGKPERSFYRRFQIKRTSGKDDYASMYEVLERRFKRMQSESGEGWAKPDVLLVDGGKGQLNIAVSVLRSLGVEGIALLGIAKPRTEHAKGDKEAVDKLFMPDYKNAIRMLAHDPVLRLLQRVRDESHRSALHYNRKKRRKGKLHSRLDDIRGVGKTRKQELMRHFGSHRAIREASVLALCEVRGISRSLAEVIHRALRQDPAV